MSSPRLTLFIPHLLWPEPDDTYAFTDLAVPALELLLARGTRALDADPDWESCLLSIFAANQHSAAALRRHGETESPADPDGKWLCADPVHLKFHHERIVLADASAFALALEESAALVAALNREFADLGRFEAPHPERWYLHLADPLDYDAPPLSAAAGRTLDLPDRGDAGRVKRWLNEIQMFLHAHPVNQAREARGDPPVNSLWFWGGNSKGSGNAVEGEIGDREIGDRPRFSANKTWSVPNFSGIWSNQPLAIGLARTAHIPQHPDAVDLGNLLAHAAPDSHHLVVLDTLLTPALYEDSTAWRDALVALEARWFAPFFAAGIAAELIAPTRYGTLRCRWTPLARFKFWRRPQPLAALARNLAAT